VGYFRSSLRGFKELAGKISAFPFDTLDGEIHFGSVKQVLAKKEIPVRLG
jgi:hypothetical protein